MEGLVESGVLADPLDGRTAAEKELAGLRSQTAVDAELEKLKAELGSGAKDGKPAA